MTQQEMVAEIERLKAENARLAQAKGGKVTKIQVSVKGAVSVYGLSRFPVTLYREQWEAIAEAMPRILATAKTTQTKAEKQAQEKASGF